MAGENSFVRMMKDLIENDPVEALTELESLTTEELGTISKIPGMTNVLLGAACSSAVLAANWNRMLDEEFRNLPVEERIRVEAMAERLRTRIHSGYRYLFSGYFR